MARNKQLERMSVQMKRMIVVFMAAVLALALVACGGSGSDDKSNENTTSSKTSETTGEESSANTEESKETAAESTSSESSSSAEPKIEDVTAPHKVELSPGSYWVGLHIPEGVYNVKVISGIGNLMTESGVTAALGSGAAADYGDTYNNLTLANGDILELTQSLTVQISTDEAHFNTTSNFKNPATETKELAAGTYTVGQDFSAGLYDLSAVEGMTINVSLSDYSFSAMLSADKNLSESSGSSYKNLELKDGQTLQVSSGTIKLSPVGPIETLRPQ